MAVSDQDPLSPIPVPDRPGAPHAAPPMEPLATSGLAIAAFVLGLLGCIPPLGIIALVLGIVAINQIDRVENRLTGRGLALAGAILGGAFTVVLALPFLVGILLPSLGAARQNAQRMENNTRLRGIHQGCVQYAQGNQQKFPGLAGDLEDPAITNPRWTSTRFSILWHNNYFTADFIISPLEQLVEANTVVTTDNFSYSMLEIAQGQSSRINEWGATANSEGAVISDRSNAIDPALSTTSIHVTTSSASSNNWRGGVAWNDNHVTFETSGVLERTRYHTMPTTDDDLFVDTGGDGYMNWE